MIKKAKKEFRKYRAAYTFVTYRTMNYKKITTDNTMKDTRAWNIISLIDDHDYFIKYKLIKWDYEKNNGLGGWIIVDNYNPVLKDEEIVTVNKNLNPGALVGIDSHYYVRDYPVTAIIHGLYQIYIDFYHDQMYPMHDKMDTMRTSARLNCVAERVIEHFTNSRRGYNLTDQRRKKILEWSEQVVKKGASISDVKKLETLLKFPITVKTISGEVLHSCKYKKSRYSNRNY